MANADPLLRDATLRLPVERCPQNGAAARLHLMRAMDSETTNRNTLRNTLPGHTRTPSGSKPEGLAILHAKIALNQDLAQREMRLTDRSERQRSPSYAPRDSTVT